MKGKKIPAKMKNNEKSQRKRQKDIKNTNEDEGEKGTDEKGGQEIENTNVEGKEEEK